MSKETILVVDDDRSIVKILRGYLEQDGFQVLTAFDGEGAIHALRRQKPDLLILDLMLPDRDGWDITRLVRADATLMTTPIIMLTARIDDTDKIIGLEIGADDYITKPFNAREVVARVRALLRRAGMGFASATVLEVGPIRLEVDRREVFMADQPIELTPTEFNLLQALMEHPGHTFTREELLEAGMGYAYEGMGRALDTHIRNLRKKIEPDPGHPIYIQTIYSIGYRLEGDPA